MWPGALTSGGGRWILYFLSIGALAGLISNPTRAADLSASGQAFFESRVEPFLAENCYACHGASKQAGGLRLDSRSQVFAQERRGLIVAHQPEKSRLLRVLDEERAKPISGHRLDEEAIETLTDWIEKGAPWPREEGQEGDGPSHWAFQPVKKPAIPEDTLDSVWVRNPIDAFILSRLEEAGLSPSPQADRRALLRRVSFDLTGLPPSPSEIDAFLDDKSPDAYRRLVDRLLASPAYGERWARHWLDVARYADTKGAVFQEEDRYPFAFTYRDYVIEAFNEDRPYDRFILEQLAADQIDLQGDRSRLAGMGFLTVGRRFLNNRHEIIDDRIDVVTRGFMGLTVACARCHDHKYDPIPIDDYYSLYGVFDSSEEPDDLPLLEEPEPTPSYQRYQEGLEERREALEAFLQETRTAIEGEIRDKVTDYLVHIAADQSESEVTAPEEAGGLREAVIRKWKRYLDQVGPGHPVFGLWRRLADQSDGGSDLSPKRVIRRIEGEGGEQTPWNSLVVEAFEGMRSVSLVEVARQYGELLREARQRWEEEENGEGDDPARRGESPWAGLRQALMGEESPTSLSIGSLEETFKREERRRKRELEREIEQWKVESPDAPARAMTVRDRDEPRQARVFKRGSPEQKGREVPRRFLKLLAGEGRAPFPAEESGRRPLAEAIASRENPLTARVIVNRLWMHHFGEPLVPGPSDFGTRSPPPSHPKLLDFLAAYLIENDWSLKAVHRLMVQSATYRQAGAFREEAGREDPRNRLLWRMNRHRLELEAWRDALLKVAGRLDRTMGGRPETIHEPPYSSRRSVYGLIERDGYDRRMPDLFRVFDFPSPDGSAPKRHETVVPQQGLYLMNWPFVWEQARALAERPAVRSADEPRERIAMLYRLTYARPPGADEMEAALRFVERVQGPKHDGGDEESGYTRAWVQLAQGLLMSHEFLYID